MFEISCEDISKLSDADLRTLVARLCMAELRAQGVPTSAVTAGGNQDAPDGGIDVRVNSHKALKKSNYVPQARTAFQVKKPSMGPTAIANEMRPGGKLRQSIQDQAKGTGAYIIVSSKDSVTDKPLTDRQQAMRDALHDLPAEKKLATDFYDSTRLASWTNDYPAVAIWVRSRLGLTLYGWGTIGNWIGTAVSEASPLKTDGATCLSNQQDHKNPALTIEAGISLLRKMLDKHKTCIRLIGLSGVGKTRFVRALFESAVGDGPLEAALSIYTDFSASPEPPARDIAQHLVATKQRAILVIDNCDPGTHRELSSICRC